MNQKKLPCTWCMKTRPLLLCNPISPSSFFFNSIIKPENMEEMVKLITIEPIDSDDEKLRYK